MFHPVDTRDAVAVRNEVLSIYTGLFPHGDRAFVPRAFDWVAQCFAGRYRDYGPIDARYHDFEHTMQGTLCLARLLRGRHAAGAAPVLTVREVELGLLAILFHDTGYLKPRDDAEGTGAKYTAAHVTRSKAFAKAFLGAEGLAAAEIVAVQNMIDCTGVNVDLKSIRFQSESERTVAYALGTADLLGQMAARDYVEKLRVLFEEFAEAARFDAASLPPGFAFANAGELVRKTPAFWENYVQRKITGDFGGLYAFLNDPYPDGPNFYLERIAENISLIQEATSRSSADGKGS